ncbi:MAG: hypothetical protein SVY53_03145 [Chloroflexota bacterium]|nr:hypothetical protein [Chloroflexota bacterium]
MKCEAISLSDGRETWNVSRGVHSARMVAMEWRLEPRGKRCSREELAVGQRTERNVVEIQPTSTMTSMLLSGCLKERSSHGNVSKLLL